ncbi:hypothetical protein [Desulfuribacillus alkaliarsenatis]|uniref:Uncharacterized protein n=1 Tax=Desulfuribacillus alkaliarsenatis TaxID=766136 RepID=A0A1E5G376_9FIRM|nr:hypothetical protein [Desulfuribacillus alkaliarsenatis]OEF97420.1 hypothetical protein BHF68_04215 [Desulfuribacillus alkaliarsenatis]
MKANNRVRNKAKNKAKTVALAVTASLVVVAATPVAPAFAMTGSEGLDRSVQYQVESAKPGGAGQDAVILPAPIIDQQVDIKRELIENGYDRPVSDRPAPDRPVTSFDDGNIGSNTINQIQDYIKENIDYEIFASLHIDWDLHAKGAIVLAFTEELTKAQQADILNLVDDPDLVKFRVVEYSEKTLRSKQYEIDQQWAALEADGIKVRTTGVSVYTNKVEVAIEPYNEQTNAKVYEMFGSDMVEVVEGFEIQILGAEEPTIDADVAITAEAGNDTLRTVSAEDEKAKEGFFRRIISFFKNLFSSK